MKKEKRRYKFVRRTANIFAWLLLFLILVLLFIRSPWGQNIIVDKLVSFVTEKTNTHFTVDKLFITFSGDLEIQGIYLEDLKKDTLLYSKNLQADIAISPLIFGNRLKINELEWEGVVANITRSKNTDKFNFSFLLDAFATSDPTSAKDSTEAVSIDIGSVNLTQFRVNYIDQFLGIHSINSIGSLHTEFETINLDELLLHINQLELSNSSVSYIQNQPLPVSDSEPTSTFPQLVFSNIVIDNVNTRYHSIPDSVLADVSIGQLRLGLPEIGLATNTYKIDGLSLQNSKILLELPEGTESSTKEVIAQTSNNFIWPNYNVKADNLSSINNELLFRTKKINSATNKFNPNSLKFSNIELKAKTFYYEPQRVNLDLETLSFREKSGLYLQHFSTKGSMDENHLSLSNIVFKTLNSSLEGAAKLNYSSVQSLIDSPEHVVVDLDMPFFKLDAKDFYAIEPSLQENDAIANFSEETLSGKLFAKGTLDKIKLTNTAVDWGSQTSLQLEGTILNGTSVDSLGVDFSSIVATTGKKDLNPFITSMDSSLTLPEDIKLSGTISGSLKSLSATIDLKSSLGDANFKGKGGFTQLPFINGILIVDSLQVGKLLNNAKLTDISLTVQAHLKGEELASLTGDLEANISRFYWNNYPFNNLSANAKINKGIGEILFDYKDENLNLNSVATIKLDSSNYDIKTSIDLIGANLNALAITQQDIRVGANIKASFLGTPETYTINTKITESASVIENDQFQTGDIAISASISQKATKATIISDFLNGGLEANGSPNQISNALLIQFENYFSDDDQFISQPDSILVNMNMNLTPKPILTEVFLRGIERLDTIKMRTTFDSTKKNIHAELQLPYVAYNGSTIDSLNFVLDGDKKDLKFSFGLNALQYNLVHVKKTYFEGVLQNKKMLLDFISYDGNEKLAHVASEIQFRKDTLVLRINPEELIFKKKKWSIPETNYIELASNFLGFQDVIISRNDQEIELSDSVSGIKANHIGLLFKNFKLQTFLSLLNPDESLGSGTVQGNLVLENPFSASGILADIDINNLGLLGNRLGNLSLLASSKELANYTIDLAIKEGPVDMNLTGNYLANREGAALNLNLDLIKLETSIIESFFSQDVQNGTGFVSGKFKLQGTPRQPVYDGRLSFNNASLDVNALNTSFKVQDETVKIDETLISFTNFLIEDAKGSSFTIDGNIGTKNSFNPSFNLNFKAEKFALLNSTAKDNNLYYGTASIDADVSLKGNLNQPKVDGKLRIRDVTELTYVVPEEQLAIEERDGVVIFVNRKNPDAILTNTNENNAPSLLRGLDVNLILEIAQEALFTLVLDEKTGDVLQVAGEAALNLDLNPNGTIGLTGRYELEDGYYRTSLYNLVSRKFDMKPGSTITWQGNPMDAKLDVTAIYRLETSAAPLMASETSGVEAGLASKYQQVMPFLVYLNVDGELTAPEISFDLGIPESAQGELGGVVYGKVQQLNSQEAELNKQVFSLLALNRFFPNTVSDGSSGGAAGLARNNVNKVLSGELNAFSDKVLGSSGFELDFDLDSFTDYTGESAQDRTQLNISASKKLFNERLIVTAGSAIDVEGSAQTGQEESPIIGNVSLEYLLTQNGRYRLKGYRKSEYTNVIDGQLIVTGLALIFNREFNEFSELFNPIEANTLSTKEKLDTKDSGPKKEKNKNEE